MKTTVILVIFCFSSYLDIIASDPVAIASPRLNDRQLNIGALLGSLPLSNALPTGGAVGIPINASTIAGLLGGAGGSPNTPGVATNPIQGSCLSLLAVTPVANRDLLRLFCAIVDAFLSGNAAPVAQELAAEIPAIFNDTQIAQALAPLQPNLAEITNQTQQLNAQISAILTAISNQIQNASASLLTSLRAALTEFQQPLQAAIASINDIGAAFQQNAAGFIAAINEILAPLPQLISNIRNVILNIVVTINQQFNALAQQLINNLLNGNRTVSNQQLNATVQSILNGSFFQTINASVLPNISDFNAQLQQIVAQEAAAVNDFNNQLQQFFTQLGTSLSEIYRNIAQSFISVFGSSQQSNATTQAPRARELF